MKSVKKDRIQLILDKILGDDACPSDVALLFLWLRDFSLNKTQDSDRRIWDLACYVSHNQVREIGKSHEEIEKVLKDLIDASQSGGSFGIGRPVFKREEVINDLITKLKDIPLSLEFDSNFLTSKKDFIINSLMELIEGTDFIKLDLEESKFVSCRLVRDGNKINYDVRLNLPNSKFVVDETMPILFPLFD